MVMNCGTQLFWRQRPTLVTGATGLAGGWLVGRLLDLGADVVCLVRDWVPRSVLLRGDMLNSVVVVRGDVRDQALLQRVLGEYEISTVFHLAAQTLVPVANRDPVSTFDTNIAGTWSLLEACRRSPLVRGVVVASSDKAYGASDDLPYRESHPLQGRHPYDVSKSCVDLLAQSYAATYQLPVVITRCGNFFGGGDLNWNRLVPGTIRAVLLGERPVIRSDGTPLRDYFFVEDAAAAYILLAERLDANLDLNGEAFNFSNEQPFTTLALVERILAAMGSDLEPLVLNEAPGELQAQHLDARKAREVLDWKPIFTVDEGLRRTIEWYRAYFSETGTSVGAPEVLS
ncbi:MAG: GDP-mannose 4,6-dehydratase [Acidobacteria bacterium]|nr:GDP-mannose 4,6-dehydratase [Acidobacteriota bacterium]